jgi:hypothetical protein
MLTWHKLSFVKPYIRPMKIGIMFLVPARMGFITLGSEVFWRRRGGENLWARPVEFHFHDVIY